MLVIRPIRMSDLEALFTLANEASYGLTTLTRDREVLARKTRHAVHSFESATPDEYPQPEGQTYLFVLEDTARGEIVGTSAVESRVGGFQPFYSFRVENLTLKSEMLGKFRELRVLHLNPMHDGPSAIGTLYLKPDYRRGGTGRFLSLVRFVFMAQFRMCFQKQVLAEMRGVIDNNGISPFWEAVGRHFFEIDFPEADYLSGVDKRFIAELLPAYPIYVDLLPSAARNVIGKVHPHTEPALKILYNEGFNFSGNIDIFEAGPLVIADVERIRTVRESRIARVGRIQDTDSNQPPDTIIKNTSFDFRAVLAGLEISGEEVILDTGVARALEVNVGDSIRIVALR